MPVTRSRIRISLPSEWDSREYVDSVYKASVPFSLGIGGEGRGADIKGLCLLSELTLNTGCTFSHSNLYSNVNV